MVAVVAAVEPQTAPKRVEAATEAMANPPDRRPRIDIGRIQQFSTNPRGKGIAAHHDKHGNNAQAGKR